MAQESSEETNETEGGRGRTPLSMVVPPAILVAVALAVGVVPHLGELAQAGAVRLEDQSAYNAAVLAGSHVLHPVSPAATEPTGVTVTDIATGTITAAGAIALALVGLYWRRIPILRRGREPGIRLVEPARRFQSGIVNDYVTWIVIGTACLGAVLALSLR